MQWMRQEEMTAGFFCNLLKLLERGRGFDVLARSLLVIRACVK